MRILKVKKVFMELKLDTAKGVQTFLRRFGFFEGWIGQYCS